MEEVILAAQGLAHARFHRYAPKVWYIMVGKDLWQGLVINTANKQILTRGPVTESGPKEALEALVKDIKASFVGGLKKGRE